MAAPGVGDVLTAIQILYGVYKTCKDAPPAVQDAMADVRQMRTELESMQRKVDDPKSFIFKNKGKMLARVRETFPPLISNLETMKSLIIEFKRIPPYSGQKLLYAYLKVPLIKEIQVSFGKYRDIYASAFLHVGAEADAQIAARNESLAKEVAFLKAQQADGNSKIDQLLKAFEEMKINQPATPSATEPMPEAVEARLRALGLKDKEVKSILAALKFDAIPPISVTPSPKPEKASPAKKAPKKDKGDASAADAALKPPPRPRASSQPRNPPKDSKDSLSPAPEAKKKRAPSPSPSATTAKPPSPQPKSPSPKPAAPAKSKQKAPAPVAASKPPSNTREIRILCVDRTNGFRSLVSQIYLQLLRLHKANTCTPPGSNWLFRNVSSCGLNRPSPLTTSAQVPVYVSPSLAVREGAFKAITGAPSYFWSDNYPFEKDGILKRVKEQETRGLTEKDLQTYDFVLCFNRDVYAELIDVIKFVKNQKGAKAEKGVDVKARVVLVPGTEWFMSSKHTHEQEVEEVTADLKRGIREWLAKELGWEKPPMNKALVSTIEGVQIRTLQMVVPGKSVKALEKRFDEIKKGKVAELEGCWVRWEDSGKGREQLVSVTGKREKLKEAEEWIKALS